MIASIQTMYILFITCILITATLVYLLDRKDRKENNQLVNILSVIFLLLLNWILLLILQSTYSNTFKIAPIYFDYLVYISTCFLPVVFLFLSMSFTKTRFKFMKKHLLLFIIPVISLIILWTNDYHHLFYKVYSINESETIFGTYFYVHTIYTFGLFIVSFMSLLKYSIKNAGLFSKQSLLILVGSSVPLIINLLAMLGFISISIYVTPMYFTFTVICYTVAILRLDFLKVAPIALQRIVDKMSDAYIIINDQNYITDFNKTFLDLFNLKPNEVRTVSFYNLITKFSDTQENNEAFIATINVAKQDNKTFCIERYFPKLNKYFNIEINSITTKDAFLGTLVLFKDITQHVNDIEKINEKQEILIEQERLATLGQMIGGIAHNLKTPIMSIAGAAEGLSDLIQEYRESIGDKDVTIEDHHEIAKDMDAWITKIRTHLSYMSDIITAVKGQAVTFSDNTVNSFSVDELIRNIDILMKHELKHALITLDVDVDVPLNITVQGNVNSLVQVVNNIISNAIQAYNGKPNEHIFLSVYKKSKKLIIKIQDNAGGLPKKVQEKLFKEMITTKGKNGTGLGLFMSYSNIKAHFNGNLRFETAEGVGTAFYIEIPIK